MPKTPTSFVKLFFRIFLHPRSTFKVILARSLHYGVWAILLIDVFLEFFKVGSKSGLNLLQGHSMIFHVFLMLAILGLLYLIFWFTAGIYFVLGKLLGGKGSCRDMFKVSIWSLPPDLVGKVFVVLAGISVWFRVVGGEEVKLSDFDPTTIPQYFLRGLGVVMGLWGAVINVILLSEGQKFSIIKAVSINFILWGILLGLSMLTGETFLGSLKELLSY